MFNEALIDKLFAVCLPAGAGRLLSEILDANDHTRLRHLLEELLDDENLYINRNVGSNRKVRADKKHAFESRQEAYSEFMNILIEKLDHGKLLPEHRVRF